MAGPIPLNSAISTNIEVSGMLMTLGSNAVLALMNVLKEGDSWQPRLLSAAGRQQWIPLAIRARTQASLWRSLLRMDSAAGALVFLGPKARSALPELERIVSHPSNPFTSMSALGAFSAVAADSDTFPAVIRIATNTPAMYRPNVGIWLRALLHRSHTDQGLQAALALCELGSPPPEVIPPLAQCIHSRRSPHRRHALQALAGLAPHYVAARDLLREAAEDDKPEIRDWARTFLNRQLSNNLSKAQ